jgi:tetraacyldisaccharide 4'-kinase
MRTPPAFWRHRAGGLPSLLLSPVASVVSAVGAHRTERAGVRVPVPVFCCGNATVGGAGKTTLALDLAGRLAARGLRPHFLTRGHGGRTGRRVLRVDLALHDASLCGDEALLLARVAPCWVSADRAASARQAVADGAGALVMDDGLQNPGLHKDGSFLVVDGATGFGNGCVLPAGPLREPPLRALQRCRAVVLIGEDRTRIVPLLRGWRPILHASLVQGPGLEALLGRKIVAFSGIGRPDKFFDGLAAAGVALARRLAFPDHHVFTGRDLAGLRAARDDAGEGTVLATTPKDAARLPAGFLQGVVIVGVSLAWQDQRLDSIIDAILAKAAGE